MTHGDAGKSGHHSPGRKRAVWPMVVAWAVIAVGAAAVIGFLAWPRPPGDDPAGQR